MTLEGIHALIDAADVEPHRFPPTLLYNEGWMLRLVFRWFQTHEVPGHVLAFHPGATWFSEALLPSPFSARKRGDRRAESRTHADGVLGHIKVGSAGKADAELHRDAMQLVVTEAKIHSPLSGGTRNAPTYDQAARTVACMAQLMKKAPRGPTEMKSLAFLVLAPREHISKGVIPGKLEKGSIEEAVRRRVQAFSPELDAWLEEWFLPTLQALTIMPMSWEQLIRDIASQDEHTAQGLSAFYEKCLKYNSTERRSVPA